MKGSHTLDPELLALVDQEKFPGRVRVLTRNSYRDDIVAFLARYLGAAGAAAVPVHTVKKHQSKAEVVLACQEGKAEGEGEGGDSRGRDEVVMFVDDSIAEHLNPTMHAAATAGSAERGDKLIVCRVLFVRGK